MSVIVLVLTLCLSILQCHLQIREMEDLFGYSFWDNTVLEATHWKFDEMSKSERNRTGKDEEWWTADKNMELQKRFHLTHNLSVSIWPKWSLDMFRQ